MAIQIIDQAGQDCFRRYLAHSCHELPGLIPDAVVGGIQGGGQVSQEPSGLVVVPVQGQPGNRFSTAGQAGCHQGGFAKTCRGSYQR